MYKGHLPLRYLYLVLLLLNGLFCCQSAFSQPLFSIGGNIGITSSNLPDKSILGPEQILRNAAVMPDRQYNTHFTPLTWSVHAGFQIPQTDHFSLGSELGFNSIDTFKYRINNNDTAIELSGMPIGIRDVKIRPIIYLLALASYQWKNNFYVSGGVGAAWVRTRVEQKGVVSPKITELGPHEENYGFKNIEPEFVIGMGWQLARHIVTYTRFTHIVGSSGTNYDSTDDILNLPGKSPEINIISAGINFLS